MRCYLCYSLLLIFLLLSTAKAEIFTTPDGYKFEALLIPDKQTILQNEPMYFSLELKNLSQQTIAFADGGDYRNEFGRPDSFNIFVVDTNKKITQKIPTRFNMGGITGPRKIPPGGKQTIRFLLPQWIKFENPGNYTVFCKKDIIISKYDDPGQFQLLKAPAVSIKVRFQIQVIPDNDDKMNELIDSFGNDILGKDYPKRNEAFKALRFINNKRIIKYLVAAAESEFSDNEAHPEFSYDIFFILSKFDDGQAFQTIIKSIDSENSEIRRNVSLALSSSPYPEAEKYLLSMRNDKSGAIRLDVVHYLGKKKTRDSTELLKKMLNDEDKWVREESKRYLSERGEN
jgi:hypothetical protein